MGHDHHDHCGCGCHDHEHHHHHDHDHCDCGCHDHEHHHHHDHGTGAVSAQTVAVLKYMLDHNIHHAAELRDLADQLSGEARHQMNHAVAAFDQANGYLAAALEQLK